MNMNKKNIHIPVLLKESIEILNLRSGMKVVDGTLGGGGHAEEIIKNIMPNGLFIGIDLDSELLRITSERLLDEFEKFKKGLNFIYGNYANITNILRNLHIDKVDRIFIDIGFSSWHIFNSKRGFSFNSGEILDMRYDASIGIPAYQVINAYSESEIADILLKYGEELYADRIAKNIIKERKKNKIITADVLKEIINQAIPNKHKHIKIDSSTKTFQALRIYVNQELDNLENFLKKSIKILNKSGIIVVISFHSMEDRLVKHFFKNLEYIKRGTILTKKPIVPTKKEIKNNPRSRSAKLRAFKINL